MLGRSATWEVQTRAANLLSLKELAAFQRDRRFQEKISLVTEGGFLLDTNIIEGIYIVQQHFTILYFSFSSQTAGDP